MSNSLADRYVGLWNEGDSAVRASLVEELFAAEGVHVLQPPAEVVAQAAALGLEALFTARGHAELGVRVRLAYETFVAPGQCRFQLRDSAVRLQDVVKLGWDMVEVASGDVVGGGVDFLLLDSAGRVVADYQFIGS